MAILLIVLGLVHVLYWSNSYAHACSSYTSSCGNSPVHQCGFEGSAWSLLQCSETPHKQLFAHFIFYSFEWVKFAPAVIIILFCGPKVHSRALEYQWSLLENVMQSWTLHQVRYCAYHPHFAFKGAISHCVNTDNCFSLLHPQVRLHQHENGSWLLLSSSQLSSYCA